MKLWNKNRIIIQFYNDKEPNFNTECKFHCEHFNCCIILQLRRGLFSQSQNMNCIQYEFKIGFYADTTHYHPIIKCFHFQRQLIFFLNSLSMRNKIFHLHWAINNFFSSFLVYINMPLFTFVVKSPLSASKIAI